MRKGSKHSAETRKKMRGHPHAGSGVYPRTEYHRSVTSNGIKKLYDQGAKMGFRLKKVFQKGAENVNWKGGVTPINEKIRKSVEYKLWWKACLERDDYTCVFCGKRGGELHVDHIKPFSLFPELRFAIDNGRTLCVPCHRQTDTYGVKIKNYNTK